MIALRLLVLFCAAFASVCASPLSAAPKAAGKQVRLCGALTKDCSKAACFKVGLDECAGISLPKINFSVLVSLKGNQVTLKRFKDGNCKVAKGTFTGQLDQCFGPVVSKFLVLNVYARVSQLDTVALGRNAAFKNDVDVDDAFVLDI